MQKELNEMSLEELWQLFPIILTSHNNEWERYYNEEKLQLQNLLYCIDIVRTSHIGSTSIGSIWAKPIIDILIEVNDCNDLIDIKKELLDNEYLCMADNVERMDFNKGYTKNGFAEKVFHIHIRLKGDNDELYFRDYLNDNKDVAKEYESLKLKLWKLYEHNRDAYTNAKTDFIKKYTTIAKNIYFSRYQ